MPTPATKPVLTAEILDTLLQKAPGGQLSTYDLRQSYRWGRAYEEGYRDLRSDGILRSSKKPHFHAHAFKSTDTTIRDYIPDAAIEDATITIQCQYIGSVAKESIYRAPDGKHFSFDGEDFDW